MRCPICRSILQYESHVEPDASGHGTAIRPHTIYSCEECGWEGIWRPFQGVEVLFNPRESDADWLALSAS